MSHIYTDTMPRKPRIRMKAKRSFALKQAHIAAMEERMTAETKARQTLMRELRVLRRVRFRLDDQTESVRQSLKLIKHISGNLKSENLKP